MTPYPNLGQIVSGTLSYAMGAGRAVVSTPYTYAKELLADGRGVLVAPGSPTALADGAELACSATTGSARRSARRAHAYSRRMIWPAVGARVPRRCSPALAHGRASARPATAAGSADPCMTAAAHRSRPAHARRPLHPISRRHLDVLTGELGIFQHAIGLEAGSRPRLLRRRRRAGARGRPAARSHRSAGPPSRTSARRSLRFLEDAFDEASGRFLNFRDVDGDVDRRARLQRQPRAGDARPRRDDRRARPTLAIVERAIALFGRALPAAATSRPRRARRRRSSSAAPPSRDASPSTGSDDERDATLAARPRPTADAPPRDRPARPVPRSRAARLALAGVDADLRERAAPAGADRGRPAPRRRRDAPRSASRSSTG